MRTLPFVITKKAVFDLEEIWLYTVEKCSIEQAVVGSLLLQN